MTENKNKRKETRKVHVQLYNLNICLIFMFIHIYNVNTQAFFSKFSPQPTPWKISGSTPGMQQLIYVFWSYSYVKPFKWIEYKRM